MSSANAVVPPLQASRRSHARRRIHGLAYVEFGPDNGAIIIDVGEGGLGFQSVMPLIMNQAQLFKFKLPGAAGYFEGFGEVAWVNESRKGGGLRFIELDEAVTSQIREWTGVPPAPESAAQNPESTSIDNDSRTDADTASESPAEIDVDATPVPAADTSNIAEAPATIPQASPDAETTEIPSASPEVKSAPQADQPAPNQTPARQSTAPAASPIPEFTIEVMPTSDSKQKSVTPKPAVRAALTYLQESPAPVTFARQPHKSAPVSTEPENLPGTPAPNSTPRAPLPQALKAGIGAAAGAVLMLALVFGVPYLKTQVQATANARSETLSLGNPATFEVEVADINNRRWILRSGGEAGSPFGDATPRRKTQSVASSPTRKSSRSDDSDNSVEITAETPQPKVAKPGELALSRPRATQTGAPSAQLTAPSTFDGITPPIEFVSDHLAAGGPEAPGIVPLESQPAVRKSTLQAAVLVQSVPPVYPVNALKSQVQGQVLVNATIGKDGIPKDLKVIKGDQRLVTAALTAIRQWRYRPATLASQPIETQAVVTVTFAVK
jgi:TonB family protein